MFGRPAHLQEFLSHHGLIDDIYKAMGDPDLSVIVLTVMDVLKKTKTLPPLIKEVKSESKSTVFRNKGNLAYKYKDYQEALVLYNKALSFAPKGSRAMKFAYGNRSALLHTLKAFSACVSDIDTCFAMDCPSEIVEKLKKRKEEASSCIWMEKVAEAAKYYDFSHEFFQLNITRNPVIPCATTSVGVVMESGLPKVVAATDVKVGALLAVETAFVSHTDQENALFSCYYCHKMNLNLKPCDHCVFALFCDENCEEKCMNEYHSIECQIIEVLEEISSGCTSRLAIKAVLKMKQMSKSWKEFISASYKTGTERMRSSSINQIFDSNYKFSLLSVKDERHFLNGPLYNASFISATIIHYLVGIPGFLPQDLDERTAAISALARILMYLSLFSTHSQIISSVSVNEQEEIEFHDTANFGWFSLIGKLNNSCNPNVLVVGLNKKSGLIAVQPIKRGTELTISYVGHWLDNPTPKDLRHKNMFMLFGVVCNCLVCTEDYLKLNNYRLTDSQRKIFQKLDLEVMNKRFGPRNIVEIYIKLCKALAFLSDVPFSEEYSKVYKMFRRCVLYLQDCDTSNMIISHQ